MQPAVRLIKWDDRQTILRNLYCVYSATKLHRSIDSLSWDEEEAEKLYREYYTHDNPLQEYNHFIIEATGFSRDFLAHISRDTKFLRMWVGSHRVSPDGTDFFSRGEFYTPSSISGSAKKSVVYSEALQAIGEEIAKAAAAGFTTEELKLLTPASVTLPITLSGSYRAIRDMCEKRACLHCQDHWYVFIDLLSKEFSDKVDPWLAEKFRRPKCMLKHKCHVKMEQLARIEKWPDGRWRDGLEVCPLYIRYEHPKMVKELEAIASEKHPERGSRVQVFYDLLRGDSE